MGLTDEGRSSSWPNQGMLGLGGVCQDPRRGPVSKTLQEATFAAKGCSSESTGRLCLLDCLCNHNTQHYCPKRMNKSLEEFTWAERGTRLFQATRLAGVRVRTPEVRPLEMRLTIEPWPD